MIQLGKITSLPEKFKWYIFAKTVGPAIFIVLILLPFAFNEVFGRLLLAYICAIFLLMLFGWGYLLLLYKFRNIVVEDGRVTFNSGIFVKQSKAIAFDRVQSVETVKGLVAALFGISEISVWTASPSQAGKIDLKNQPDGTFYLSSGDAEWLKNFIISRTPGTK
jgi:uncharacterized membrane protein YdbT with pleckstrin-like domain